MDMWSAIADERRRLADDLETLSPAQWQMPTVCDLWDVKTTATHVVLPFVMSKPVFIFTALKNKRDIPKTVNQLTLKMNERLTTDQIIAELRKNAESKWAPPGTDVTVPFAEIVVHASDIRRATGLTTSSPPAVIATLLDALEDDQLRADYERRTISTATP